MSRLESAHDLKGKSVYILTVLSKGKPDPIPFATKLDRARHLCDLISRVLQDLDDRFRSRIVAYLEAKDYDKVIRLFRRAQMENTRPISLDFFESDTAHMIM
jgi:hypothetical protein